MSGWNQRSRKRSTRQSHKSPEGLFHSGSPQNGSLSGRLELATNFSLFATLLSVLLVFGGRDSVGQLVLLAGTTITSCLYFLQRAINAQTTVTNRRWKWTGLEPIFLLAIGLFLFQLTPISNLLVNTVSPGLEHLLGNELPDDLIPAAPVFSSWNRVSLAPRETRLSMIAIICVMALFLILVQQFQNRERAKRAVLCVGIGTGVYSAFGIIQYLFSNDKFFWLFEHPYIGTLQTAKASLTNSNHFAGLLALSLGPILAWTICRQKNKTSKASQWKDRSYADGQIVIGAIAMILILIGIALSGSRGGLLLAATAFVVTLLLLVIKKLTDARVPILLGAIAIISGGCYWLVGDQFYQKNSEELFGINFNQLDEGDARSFIWSSNIKAWEQFPIAGTGLGTHEDIIPAFHIGDANGMNYTHAENSYLQIRTETGIAGWCLLGIAILLILWTIFRKIRSRSSHSSEAPILVGIAGSFCVFLIHGCYDFAWYAPAYMLVLGVYLAFLFTSQNDKTEEALSSSRLAMPQFAMPQFAMAGLVLVAGYFASAIVLPAASAQQSEFQYAKLTSQGSTFKTAQDELNMLRLRIISLKQSLQADAEIADNHLRLAKCLRRVFELKMKHSSTQSMPLSQIRGAVYSGGFESPQQLQAWLNNPAVLKSSLPLIKACLYHAKLSLKHSPAKSKAYLIYSDLCFVENPDPLLPEYYLSRAELAQPYSPSIKYTAGLQAWGQGDVETALTFWKEVYANNEKTGRRIIEIVSPVFPPSDLVKIFEPNLNQLTSIVKAYKPFNEKRGQEAILLLARITLDEVSTMNNEAQQDALVNAFSYLNASELEKQTSIYIQLATEIQPDSEKMHNVFGRWLVKHKKYQQALPHLQYCANLSPYDSLLKKLVHACEQQARTQAGTVIRPAAMEKRFK